jgi:hypothetical protein
MQPWIMNPRIHCPPLGNSLPPSPSAGVSVDGWMGDELPPRRASGSTRVYFVNANGMVHTCHQSVRRHFDNSKLIMASSTRSYGSTYKPGGTLQLSRGSITGRVIASGADDMGRWCWTTYKGSANRRMAIITAYQVCEGAPVHDVTLH